MQLCVWRNAGTSTPAALERLTARTVRTEVGSRGSRRRRRRMRQSAAEPVDPVDAKRRRPTSATDGAGRRGTAAEPERAADAVDKWPWSPSSTEIVAGRVLSRRPLSPFPTTDEIHITLHLGASRHFYCINTSLLLRLMDCSQFSSAKAIRAL